MIFFLVFFFLVLQETGDRRQEEAGRLPPASGSTELAAQVLKTATPMLAKPSSSLLPPVSFVLVLPHAPFEADA
jgi:hypothetical protein